MKKRIIATLLTMAVVCMAMVGCGSLTDSNATVNEAVAHADKPATPEQKDAATSVEIDEEPTAFERLFSNGSIPAQDKNGLWGYIDISGNYVIAPSFSGARPFGDNEIAFVQDTENQLWGLIDQSGKYIVEPMFSEIGDSFCDNLLRVMVPERGWGYIDQSGEMAIEPQFDVARDFHNGFARVSTQISIYTDVPTGQQYWYNKYGYINTSGERITEEIFTDAYDFSEGLALVSEDLNVGRGMILFGYYGYIDDSGEYVIHPYEHYYEEATSFANGRAFGKAFLGTEKGEWHYFEMIDKEGNILFRTDSDGEKTLSNYCGDSTGGHAYFTSDLRAVPSPDGTGYVYIDLDGNVVLPSVLGEYYGEAGEFRDGYAFVQDAASSLYGCIDLEGNWVIPPQYLTIRNAWNGIVCGEQGSLSDVDNRKLVVMDIAKNYTWELDRFASVSPTAPDRLMVVERNEASEYIVNFRYRDGKVAIDASFEASSGFSYDCSYAKVKHEGLWGIIDKDGNWLIPARFLAFE